MFCTKCGNKIEEGTKFCVKCGQGVDTDYTASQDENIYPTKKKLPVWLIITIPALIAIIVVAGLFFISDTRFNEGLIEVKNLVIQGKFYEATDTLNQLKIDNGVYLAINTFDIDSVSTAIEEHRLCVINEYPTYDYHSGIEGCVFWARHNDLERKEVWINDYKEQEVDRAYCNKLDFDNKQASDGSIFGTFWLGSYSDPKCRYKAFKDKKRQENWGYLVSDEWDDFTEHCALESCPLPEELKF